MSKILEALEEAGGKLYETESGFITYGHKESKDLHTVILNQFWTPRDARTPKDEKKLFDEFYEFLKKSDGKKHQIIFQVNYKLPQKDELVLKFLTLGYALHGGNQEQITLLKLVG